MERGDSLQDGDKVEFEKGEDFGPVGSPVQTDRRKTFNEGEPREGGRERNKERFRKS